MRAKELARIARLAQTLPPKVEKANRGKWEQKQKEVEERAHNRLAVELHRIGDDLEQGVINEREAELLKHTAHKAYRDSILPPT